ncbi:MAG: leucyl aminopeptidase [Planctomycetes bacterium]|nr:leucyl aminopeptidase [Planctomycetota bacterium]
MIQVHLAKGRGKSELTVVCLHEKERVPAWVNTATQGAAARAKKLGDFAAKTKETLLLYGDASHPRVLLVGLGARKTSSPERVRRAVGRAIRHARKLNARTVLLSAPNPRPKGPEFAQIAARAAILADYSFDECKGKSPKRALMKVSIEVEGASAATIRESVCVAEGTNLARDLGNRPGNVGTPTHLANEAKRLGKKHGFRVKILLPADIKRLGMGGLIGVAKGSAEPARFIEMEWSPKKVNRKAGTLCLVGKGLTFDSGGISIKPAANMWDMKFDKCGGCAVIGAMSAIAAAKLPIRVVALVPATENMPGAAANKPGDVLTALNGKTIEVLNTDAEGRLILADALAYSARFKPDVILDFATLTGAVMIALGDVRAAVMGNDEALLKAVRAAGDDAGERVWPLPMDEEYGEQVKSSVADVKNLGKGRLAGSIAAGWFLRNFVPEGPSWVHVDIAGVAWNGDVSKGYVAKGATGFGVALAYAYAKARSQA